MSEHTVFLHAMEDSLLALSQGPIMKWELRLLKYKLREHKPIFYPQNYLLLLLISMLKAWLVEY